MRRRRYEPYHAELVSAPDAKIAIEFYVNPDECVVLTFDRYWSGYLVALLMKWVRAEEATVRGLRASVKREVDLPS